MVVCVCAPLQRSVRTSALHTHAACAMLEVGNASEECDDDLPTVEELLRDLPTEALKNCMVDRRL